MYEFRFELIYCLHLVRLIFATFLTYVFTITNFTMHPPYDLTMLNSAVSSVQHQITSKVAHIQEHLLPLYDLTMLDSAVSSVQHQITLR
jgi:hypothetical protein